MKGVVGVELWKKSTNTPSFNKLTRSRHKNDGINLGNGTHVVVF